MLGRKASFSSSEGGREEGCSKTPEGNEYGQAPSLQDQVWSCDQLHLGEEI